MSFKTFIKSLSLREMEVAYRPPQVYSNVAPGPDYDIFVVTGGIVNIYAILGYLDTVVAAAITMGIAVNGIEMQNAVGIVAVNGAQGDIIMWPMGDTAATDVVVPGVAVANLRTDQWVVSGIAAQCTGPCDIVLTCGAAAMVAPESISFRVLYHRLEPSALIAPA